GSHIPRQSLGTARLSGAKYHGRLRGTSHQWQSWSLRAAGSRTALGERPSGLRTFMMCSIMLPLIRAATRHDCADTALRSVPRITTPWRHWRATPRGPLSLRPTRDPLGSSARRWP
ncbi:hypothetical protein KUCAC02_008536, partial [Chaenocephalus aceratus]